jgi:hypothetical protein
MHIKRINCAMLWAVVTVAAILGVGFWAPQADAHHSYAMYDATVYRVFTGVMVRIVPNAAHFEMHFVPLNEDRNALAKDDDGEPLVWVVQMESAAQAQREDITEENFPQGTVFSMGVHPLRNGRRGGDRGESGLFRCPQGSVPEPGMHCDSVAGNTPFGDQALPSEGRVSSD